MSEPTAAPYVVTYTYPNSTGQRCIICKTQRDTNNIVFPYGEKIDGIVLPYGSRFDGQFVCSDCVRLFIDPLIALATGNIKERE